MQHPTIPPAESFEVMVVLGDDPMEDAIIWLAGEHDLSSVEDVLRAITMAVDAGPSDVIIDLSRIEFMDTTTIHQILEARTRLATMGRTARVRNPSHSARFLLELCDLTQLVEP